MISVKLPREVTIGENMEMVDTFKYLGVILTKDGKSEYEITIIMVTAR